MRQSRHPDLPSSRQIAKARRPRQPGSQPGRLRTLLPPARRTNCNPGPRIRIRGHRFDLRSGMRGHRFDHRARLVCHQREHARSVLVRRIDLPPERADRHSRRIASTWTLSCWRELYRFEPLILDRQSTERACDDRSSGPASVPASQGAPEAHLPSLSFDRALY